MNPRFFRLRLLFAAALLSCCSAAWSQGFTIEHFHADITLRLDGSFLIEENINVNFSEQKHGIFRSIPFKYSTFTTESSLAQGRVMGQPYTTYLDSLNVKGYEFEVTEEGDYKKLRIGSGDTYVTGRQQYRLSYIVYGAINRFPTRDELYWNVNGTEWPASADTISVDVYLPNTKLKLDAAQCKLFTGKAGERGTDAKMIITPGHFSAVSTRRFDAYEGLTIGLALPKNLLRHANPPLRVLARDYLYDSIHTVATLNPNGSITVEEYIVVDVITPNTNIKREIPGSYGVPGLESDTAYAPPSGKIQLNSAFYYLPQGSKITNHTEVRNETPPTIELGTGNGSDISRQVFSLQYTLWQSSHMYQGKMAYYVPWLGSFLSEPVRAASIEVKWPAGYSPIEKGTGTLSYLPLTGLASQFDARGAKGRLTRPNMPGEAIFFAFMLQGPGFKPAVPPMRLTGGGDYHDGVDVTLQLDANGRLHVHERIFLSPDGRPSLSIDRPIHRRNFDFGSAAYDQRDPTLFRNEGDLLMTDLRHPDNYEYQDFSYPGAQLRIPVPYELNSQDSAILEYQYALYGLLKKDGDAHHLNFPLVSAFDDPVEHVHFRIFLPNNPQLTKADYQVYFSGNTSPLPIQLHYDYKNGVIEGHTTGLTGGQTLDLRLRLPAGTIQTSFWLEFVLFFYNQATLTICLFLSLLIAVLWFFIGRDKRFTIVPAFLPPDDLTPAEAGLLFDGHLHDRDILSLIYYWGAKGHIKIEEIEVNGGVADYKLRKLKALPRTAKDFEKTIFNGLFEKKDAVSIASLNQKFYVHMGKARTQIQAHASSRGYYLPGTVAFSNMLMLLGIGVGGFTLIWLLGAMFGMFDSVHSALDCLLGLGLLSATMIGFSLIMPKHGPFGHKRYRELMGFREFLDKAERDRLRLLQDENPDYFGLTLSYAIGLGMANRWVEKFGSLLTAPPSYYSSSTSTSTFDVIVFNTMMTRQLTNMSNNFTSKPPPPPSSGGGSSWGGGSSSGGSSYRSSSSYSGGGSSYSSSGSSGGGYGGGGGGSW
jgi:hypothetical protein